MGCLDVVQYLIETCGIDQKAKDNQGRTAYDLAQSRGKRNVVQYMEKRTADTTAITTTRKKSKPNNRIVNRELV